MDRIGDVEEGDNIEYGCTGLKKLKSVDNIEYGCTGLEEVSGLNKLKGRG